MAKKVETMKRLTTKQFVEKAKEIHGDKYDYSKIEYVNSHTKVCIICPVHGEFWQTPEKHLIRKHGCNLCSKPVHDTNSFIEKATEIHKNKYDYSKIKYVDSFIKVKIICPTHGEFLQQPNNHLQGQGCPKCKGHTKLSTNEFVERAKETHHNKYDYSKVEYCGTHNDVCIICPIHGEFWQTPHNHLKGQGCPICNESKLELEVKNILEENNIQFISQCRKNTLNWLGKQSLDFYLPAYNIAIECQGRQHFESDKYFGGDNGLAKQIERDKTKYKKCIKNKIQVLYYTKPHFKSSYNAITDKETLINSIKKYGNNL